MLSYSLRPTHFTHNRYRKIRLWGPLDSGNVLLDSENVLVDLDFVGEDLNTLFNCETYFVAELFTSQIVKKILQISS
jgi:hypothetical protein